jgi:hypothetical protein
MTRILLISACIGVAVAVIVWFIIPASTYVENALGILMLTFIVAVVVAIIIQYFWRRKKP